MKASRTDVAALATLGALFAVRFQAPLLGGRLYLKDAGFFFVPWRTVLERLLRAGELPLWNEAMGNGRALAADPNAAAFWPFSLLHLLLSPTGVAMADAALAVALAYAGLRLLRLSPVSSAAGAAVFLLSGVFQSLPVYFGMLAATGPLALALGAFGGLEPPPAADAPGRIALTGLGLGLTLLAGEPAVTAMGAVLVAGTALVRAALDRPRARSWLRALALSGLLAIGVSAVQLLPAARELARSARAGGMKAEHGALFWSVRPGRALSLLEPRLLGDPFAERDDDYWGAGTFDAGNPYFLDLALGVLPLAFALGAIGDPRGRGALALAGVAALLSLGRFLPGYAAAVGAFRPLGVLRYPEKWWLPATLGLAAAAAVGVEVSRRSSVAGRPPDLLARRRLGLGAGVVGGLALGLWGLGVASPARLRDLLWGLGLGAGETPAERIVVATSPGLLLGLASLGSIAVLAWLVDRGRLGLRAAGACLGLLFLLDGARRVVGTCPTRSADTPNEIVSLVHESMKSGRFHDDGADLREVAMRRVAEAGGVDPLRPETGVLFGIAYAGENDVDRMMPEPSVVWARATAALPWGPAKVARLRSAGVATVRTAERGPDPPGVASIGASGQDRVLSLLPTRPPFGLVEEAWIVPDGAAADRVLSTPGRDPMATVVVEVPGMEERRRRAAGAVRVVESRASRQRLEIEGPAGAALVMPRTYDPYWRATVDGASVPLLRADGPFSAILLPPGARTVVLEYRNPLFLPGAVLSLLSLVTVWRALVGFAAARPLCEDRGEGAARL